MEENEIIQKTIRIGRKEIAFFKHVLEGYEHFGTVTTIENDTALLELSILPGFLDDVEKLLESLRKEIEFFDFE